ncbi:hypothetical protein CK203_046029 [Vitis vinifera]|uniref:DUF4283 domain-containing protein n=1 Tax=Vitis vinifera TaxID=29760 RepID=A0A438HGT6_VITVI|nr:hypothetical protein CK203_046029 [Vitis vinifera]
MGEPILWCGTRKSRSFYRLGVVDKEKRRFNIFIPKGEAREGVELHGGDVYRRWGVSGKSGSERRGNQGQSCRKTGALPSRADSWSSSSENGMDMERLGWLMARSWGLQGKLGLARMEKGRILLEFQYVGEADRVLSSRKQAGGRRSVGVERWSPRCGCEDEGGSRKEVWVKILGLPVSLWVPSILRKVGDECGGFVAMDPMTEKMVDLEWARILVKKKNGGLPSRLDLVVEEVCYSLYLWWEVRPEMRKATSGSRSKGNYREEVRGDDAARAIPRVGEEESARPEALLPYADENDGQVRGAVGDGTGKRARAGSGARVLVDLIRWMGFSTQARLREAGLGIGPSYSKPDGWIDVGESPDWSGSNGLAGEYLGPSQPESRKGKLERGSLWAD